MNAKRFVAIVNPHGGIRRGEAVLGRVRPVFGQAGAVLDVHTSQYAGHAVRIARDLDLTGYDGLCVIGGDGTAHEVVNGLMQADAPPSIALGLIPAGTGNTLHRQVGCHNPVDAARRILAGNTSPLDVARVTTPQQTVYCVNIVGWGSVGDINQIAEKLRWLGPSRYAAAALWQTLRPRPRRAVVVLDGEQLEGDFLLVIACNTKTTGSGMMVAPRAEIDDGRFDVVLVRDTSRLQILRLLARVFRGTHLRLPCVEYRQASSFSIASESQDPLDLDGEMKCTTPLSAELMPGALRVFT